MGLLVTYSDRGRISSLTRRVTKMASLARRAGIDQALNYRWLRLLSLGDG